MTLSFRALFEYKMRNLKQAVTLTIEGFYSFTRLGLTDSSITFSN